MKKWGLGIEHEMRIRFEKSINDLPKNVQDKLFYNVKNKYIFIDSSTLLYYFKMYEIIFMKDFGKYAKTNEEKLYNNIILLKRELLELAINNNPFPINDKKFFNLDTPEDKHISMQLFKTYLNYYTIYNAPILLFEYNFYDNVNMRLGDFMDYKKINELIINNENIDIVIKFIEEKLDNLYNNYYEKQAFNFIKEKLQNTKDLKFNYDYNKLCIYINFVGNNNSKKNIDKLYFIDKIEKYINNIKNIFNDNNNNENYKFYKNLFVLYNNNIPHIDYTYQTEAIEIKTINYENINYEKVLNDLIDLEKTFFYAINNMSIFNDLLEMFGSLMYHNIGSIKNSIVIYDLFTIKYNFIDEDYTGSYHIWITAPYTSKTPMKEFLNIHSTLANKLQLLEPILAAHYGSPSYNAIDNNSYSKSSLRQMLNSTSNFGTSDVSLINGAKKYYINNYYLSEEDIINGQEYLLTSVYSTYIYDNKGNIIKNYNKLDERMITNNIFQSIEKGNDESPNNLNIHNYFNMVFEKSYIRPIKKFLLGSDIRTNNLNEYFYPLDKEWKRCLIMKNNKLVEVYYNKKLNKISYERIFSKNTHKENLNNRMGIEFRIFDHFPTHYLNQILCLLVPIVIDSVKYPRIIKFKNTYVAKQFWHNEMCDVLMNGYKYNLGITYLHALEKEFNIKFESKKSINTEIVLSELYNKLYHRYSRSYKNSLFNKMKFSSEIKFVNFNKKAWKEIINKYFQENPKLLRKILYLNNNLKDEDIINILGKDYHYDINKIKNYFKNIVNEK